MAEYYKHRTQYVFRVCAGILLAVCVAILLGLTIAGFFDRFNWLCDLVVHFRVQYAVAFFICTILSGILHSYRIMTIAWIGLLINLGVLVATYWGFPAAPDTTSKRMRVLVVNVNTENRLYEATLTAIRSQYPDVIVVEEINDEWLKQFKKLEKEYRYSCVKSRSDNFGIGVYSKIRLIENDVVYIGDSLVPCVRVAVKYGGQIITIYGIHSLPPGSHDYWLRRNKQLAGIAEWCGTNTGPRLVVGDFSTTPWSHAFRTLVRDSGLTDSACGWHYQPTWPVGSWIMKMPIDHVLASDQVQVLERTVGPDMGSDHLPVYVEFIVNP